MIGWLILTTNRCFSAQEECLCRPDGGQVGTLQAAGQRRNLVFILTNNKIMLMAGGNNCEEERDNGRAAS